MYIVLSYSKTFDNLHLENMKSTRCLCSLYFRVLTLRLFSPEGRLHLFIVVNGSEKNQNQWRMQIKREGTMSYETLCPLTQQQPAGGRREETGKE